MKPPEEFTRLRSAPDGRRCQCKVCQYAANRRWREANPAKHRASSRNWHAANREESRERAKQWRQRTGYVPRETDELKRRAREAVRAAIKAGELVRPAHCTTCRQPANVEAHHPDYMQPLTVQWLCRLCHAALHRAAA